MREFIGKIVNSFPVSGKLIDKGHMGRINSNKRQIIFLEKDEIEYSIIHKLIKFFEEKKPFLKSEINICDIAFDIYTNRTYLSRILNQHLNINFNTYVNFYRVYLSCLLIQDLPSVRVKTIGEDVGFINFSTFSHSFKFFTNYTPYYWWKRTKTIRMLEENLL